MAAHKHNCPYPESVDVITYFDGPFQWSDYVMVTGKREYYTHLLGFKAFWNSLDRGMQFREAEVRRLYYLKEDPETNLREKICIHKREQFESYLRESKAVGRHVILFVSFQDYDNGYDATYRYGEGSVHFY